MSSVRNKDTNVLLEFFNWRFPPSNLARAASVIILVCLGVCAGYFFYQTVVSGHGRNLLLWFLFAVIALTTANVWAKRYLLKHKRGASDSMKLWAEVWAGCALLGFSGPFLQLGTSLDNLFANDRLSRLEWIRTDSDAILDCVSPSTKATCQYVKTELKSLEALLAKQSEKEISQTVFEVEIRLESLKKSRSDRQYQERVDVLIDKVDSIDRGDKLINKILQPLPIVSLLFASFAISSKIALAWHEKEKKAKEAKEKEEQEKRDAEKAKAMAAATDGETDAEGSGALKTCNNSRVSAEIKVNIPATVAVVALGALTVAIAFGTPKDRTRSIDDVR